jgi:hypothetical protein
LKVLRAMSELSSRPRRYGRFPARGLTSTQT